MDVILLQKVENLGGLGDRVSVRPGYARNYLIPFGKAVPATPDRIAEFENRRAELERQAAENFAHAQARKADLESVTVTLRAKASSEGKLYGSIGNADVAEALTASGHPVERREVRLPDGPIRMIGEYDVAVHLHTEVDAVIHIVVVGEE
ncbi:MAG TPA: 50S ribosomal protein L9 [Candidatus Acidoferrales bacterium]|nr:50S ribosomal protein L9 [Candidatus Acidoferrales bacterium]